MNKNVLAAAAATGIIAISAYTTSANAEVPADTNARIAKLEQELQLLKRQLEVKEEVETAKAAKAPNVEFGKKGLLLTSPDKEYSLKVGGYAQIDTRTFLGDEDRNSRNDILARRLRPIVEGTYQDFGFRLMPDFGGSGFKLFDAYFEYKPYEELNFRLGKFKPPLGLERLQSATDTFFVERGDPTNLAPNRDLGFQVFGNVIPELEYQVGIFNGGADLANNENNEDDDRDIFARIFATPFSQTDITALQGLGVGIAGSFGEHKGTTGTPILPSYRTAGQSTFFNYRTGAFSNGDNWRLYPQAYYYYNNIGLIGEYAVSSQEVRLGAASEQLENHAWQLAGSYVLTGEDVNYKGSVKPENPFDPKNGDWGAFEIVGRIGETDIDDDAFPIFSNPATSASRASSVGTGLNWYWNENVKLMVDYETTSFERGRVLGADRDDEDVILTRLQFRL